MKSILCTALIIGLTGVTWAADIQPVAPTSQTVMPVDAAKQATLKKLKAIKFPRLFYRDAWVVDVFHNLIYESRKLDPSGEGVEIFRHFDDVNRGIIPTNCIITADLRNISMLNALDSITRLAGLKYEIMGHAVVLGPDGPSSLVCAQTAEQYALGKKARALILPMITFTDDGLSGVLFFLSDQSRLHDPQGTGVNILAMIPSDAMQQTKITLDLRNVSLMDALIYIADMNNLRLRVDDNVIILYTLDR